MIKLMRILLFGLHKSFSYKAVVSSDKKELANGKRMQIPGICNDTRHYYIIPLDNGYIVTFFI